MPVNYRLNFKKCHSVGVKALWSFGNLLNLKPMINCSFNKTILNEGSVYMT